MGILCRWHNTECLESGKVILKCKDGKFFPAIKLRINLFRNNEALGEDIMNLNLRRESKK